MTINRRDFVARFAWLAGSSAGALGALTRTHAVLGATSSHTPWISSADLKYLSDLAAGVVNASRVAPGQSVASSVPNTTGGILIRPGGRNDYPSCWVRDFAMSIDSGFITVPEIVHHLRVFCKAQNGSNVRHLHKGAWLPPYAIPDHVNFDGKAVFYPGTYSSGNSQGGEPWGACPPVSDHYLFTHIAHTLWSRTGSGKFLDELVDGLPVIERLIRAFDAPTVDPKTGVVTTEKASRAVGFGFLDSVYMTGHMLIPTMFRLRAARELTQLCRAAKHPGADRFDDAIRLIKHHTAMVFAGGPDDEGWLKASTGVSGQCDVWGTLLALRFKALPPAEDAKARETVAKAVRNGTIEYQGAVRQVPTNHDFNTQTAWQRSWAPLNTYQNGAYWSTATGWLIDALFDQHPSLAKDVLQRYITHLKTEDFRKGKQFSAPWECFGHDGAHRGNPVYMTSMATPFPIIKSLALRSKDE